ncbi:hypothetical protein QIH01_20240 [Brevibacillus brevis]|nr:hypothetical protein QIH01_20240 [Brevibacillus brevis]
MTSKRELIYIFVIMLLGFSAVTLCTIMFVVSEKAILGISVASTLVSIILAVLAIIYTYVDSSAQKDNVRQMREATERLEASVQDEKEIIGSFSFELAKVSALKDELLTRIAETQEWRDGILKQLKEMSEAKQGNNSLEISEIEKVMNEEKKKPRYRGFTLEPELLKYIDSNVVYSEMLAAIQRYPDGTRLDINQITTRIEASYDATISKNALRGALDLLKRNGYVKETTVNGFEIFYKLEKQQ